ncbi:MAG: crossover junction endodeoxyribonuclease RuvC [Candidatus Komeilibacteria bacterium CG11_big_fil_rev_8_21_14_0_20_36_20]|uniref:Crossover junction endodeoxyribonuclease RuvC n=1 Tax=Candidatus Komeilibacteria bacterium CG11_big_fil_rev_8_21_14_0_20_36_20 TaxID=1974477 RepID=A0A2H0NCM4_9BACT|nr:MAG: crossover junction endodeoxyribonuclease RuvC [Candidatus Komeilibacteria bacterium CG11_big_fil_rev_8_21_14_0_20_36_20]PIR81947.1 MAG: crossover junction endodeoxyribonuclease RuvC [Candidatus Komeilibacteria bacterium CG10_big_fil_rev_8_21_14_0_10_36_65]PJC55479.1 MAG: crossover junction endodeoxyribonuclease RuvC [Candidatus Komeilibacteria bacterium CG_4_9_14_0_2_um_filter_36_13]
MLSKPRIILGLDPGLADTGFGVISVVGNQLTFMDAGSIQTAKQIAFTKRLESIFLDINKIIKKYQPDLVAVEKLYFARNVTTALSVGEARGVILLAIQQNNKELLEFTPLQIKQALTTSGQASKKQVGQMVKAILKLAIIPQPDDVADALAIAITASFFNKKLV